jgi:hypothetical protein
MGPGERRERLEAEGAKLLPLVVGWSWVERRVESVSFPDDVLARREVAITFTAPDEPRTPGKPTYLPLTLMPKDDVTGFDFVDEDDRRLPLLPSIEKGVMGSGLLIALLRDVLAERDTTLTEGLLELNRSLAEGDSAQGSRMLAQFKEQIDQGHPSRYIAEALSSKSSPKARIFRALQTQLAYSHLVVVPLECGDCEKRVVRFSYLEPIVNRYRTPALQLPPPVLLKIQRSIGWLPRQYWFPIPALGQGGSYHFNITVPDGLKMTEVTLIATRAADDSRHVEAASLGTAPKTHAATQHVFTRAGSPGVGGIALVRMRGRGAAMIRGATLTTVSIAAVLAIGYAYLGQLLSSAAQGHIEAAASALLLFPSLAAIYVVNAGEHRLTTALVFGVRALTIASAVLSFFAAGVLVLAPAHAQRIWMVLMVLAVVIAIALLESTRVTWLEDEPFRARRARMRSRPPEPAPELHP